MQAQLASIPVKSAVGIPRQISNASHALISMFIRDGGGEVQAVDDFPGDVRADIPVFNQIRLGTGLDFMPDAERVAD